MIGLASRIVSVVLIVLLLGLPVATLEAMQFRDGASPGGEAGFDVIPAKANAARDENRLEDAQVLYKKALALCPGGAEGWWALGTIEYDQNAYSDAASVFDKLIALVPWETRVQ